MVQLTSGRQLAQVAPELGVDAQVIRRWNDQVTVDAATAFLGKGRVRTEDAEVQRLRQEVTQLRAERDFLKAASAARAWAVPCFPDRTDVASM